MKIFNNKELLERNMMSEELNDDGDSKIRDYILETAKSISSIKRRTKNLIDMGWKPLGGASTYLNEQTMIVFIQALIKDNLSKDESEYDIVSTKSAASLAVKIKELLNNDWIPCGSGFVFRSKEEDFIFCQTIVR